MYGLYLNKYISFLAGYISDMISDLWTFLESMTDCSDVCWTTHLSTVGSKSYEVAEILFVLFLYVRCVKTR